MKTLQVHTNGGHKNGKRGSHVSTVSIYRQEDPMGGERLTDEQMKWLALLGLLEHISIYMDTLTFINSGDDPDTASGIGMCGWLLTTISWFLVIITLPFSLCVCFKVWDDVNC